MDKNKRANTVPTCSRHHFIPTSLGGEKHSINIHMIPHWIHVELHKRMNLHNLELRLYRGWYNIQKPQHCDQWKQGLDIVHGMLDLQLRYYRNFTKLPWEWLRELHMSTLHDVSTFYAERSLPRLPNFAQAWQQYRQTLIYHCQRHHGA